MFIGKRGNGYASLITRLMLGTAFSGIALGGAIAQTPAPDQSTPETVVVTGTSIRGAAPVGSDLITVDRAAIEATGAQTVQQLLSTTPQINTFGGSGQGGSNSDFSGGFAPAIHAIGGGSSSATLVLIDGHRFPTQGLTEAQADPSVLPASVLERVEVLPDGASAIYGSDAVAGVINFITRKDFTGMEVNVQSGVADHYNTFTGSIMGGYAWSGGSVLMAYDYTNQSNLMYSARDFTTSRQDIRRGAANPSLFTGIAGNPPAGSMTTTPAAGPGTTGPYGVAIPYPSTGVNFQTFNCPVATIAANSTAPAYYYQPGGGYGGPSYSTATAGVPSQGACDQLNSQSLLPSTVRNSGVMQFRQQITGNLAFDMELVYGSRVTNARMSRGTLNAQVFGPNSANTSQINPFYVSNPAIGNTSEFVRYDFNSLLGPGAYTKQLDNNLFVTSGLAWDLGDDREIALSAVAGNNLNSQHISGVVSSAEGLLALNGTTNTNGVPGATSEQDIYGLGTVLPATRALNINNALDVWNPAASNRTSKQVLASLRDGGSVANASQGLQDFTAKFDGPIFALPAGPVKVAVGGEFIHSTMDEYGTTNNAVGPSLSNSAQYYYREGRSVYAGFLEFNAPLVSPEMNIPLIENLSVDVSGRYDHYSDFGSTQNPKVGFDWRITEGLKARGSYGTSFVAPTIHDAQNFNSQSQVSGLAAQIANPVIAFNSGAPYNGGAGIAGTWVSTPSSCAQGGGVPVNAAGQPVGGAFAGSVGCKVTFAATNGTNQSAALTVAGGNGSLKPATGRSYSGGFDIDFGKFIGALDGLTTNLTYWDVAYHGLITNQQTQNNIPQLTTFAPIGGWTPQSTPVQNFVAGRPISVALPATIWATFDGRLQNAFNLWENGIDFAVNYVHRTDTLGTFQWGLNGTELLRYSQQGGNTGPVLDTKDGKNAPRYNSQDLVFRNDLGWIIDSWATDLAVNYIHPYAITNSNFPYNLAGPDRGFAGGFPPTFNSAGTAHVGAVVTLDLNVNYLIPKSFLGMPDVVTDGSSVSLTVQNLLDTDPPFASGSTGNNPATYGYVIGNPIGRLITIGLRKKF
jgi:iron complex outermembrane receptor protein